MSRSYRKPYASFCGGNGSAKKDKTLAHRGVRRAHNRIIQMMLRDPELNIPLPHFRECSCNNVYGWNRDGKQHLQVPTARERSQHMLAVQGLRRYSYELREPYLSRNLEWPPKWYIELMRK